MEKTMEHKELTTLEMLNAVEQNPAQAALARREGLSAMEAFKASTSSVIEVILQYVERLLTVVLPQVWALLAIIRQSQARADGQIDILGVPSDVEGQSWGQVKIRLEAGIACLKASAVPAIKRAFHLSALRYKLSQKMDGREAEDALDWAVKEGYFRPAPTGFSFRGENYAIADGFGLTPADEEEVLRLIGNLRGLQLRAISVRQSAGQAAKLSVAPKPRAMQKISAKEAWRGALGKFQLAVPPNGKDRGGTFQVESQEGGQLFIASASKGFSDLESAAIPLSSIRNDEDGSIRDGLKLVAPAVLSGDKLDKWKWRMERLGGALERGFRAILGKEENDIEPRVFLDSDAAGKADLCFVGAFNWNPPEEPESRVTITDLKLRFSRNESGEIALVEVVSEDEGAHALFDEAVGKYCEPGPAFTRVRPLQCKVFLRAVYGQVVQGKV